MVNHILHPLGDRILCEPDSYGLSARSISTDPESASCPECKVCYDQLEGLRHSLGLTESRRMEIQKRAEEALVANRDLHPDYSISLTPHEVLDLLSAKDIAEGRSGVIEAHRGLEEGKHGSVVR